MYWIALALGIAALVLFIWKKRRESIYEEFVQLNSEALKKLNDLNTEYCFQSVANLDMENSYDNENFYRDVHPMDYLTYQLIYKKQEALKAIEQAEENYARYLPYKKQVDIICNSCGDFGTATMLRDTNLLHRMEQRLLSKNTKKPITSFSIQVILFLTDMGGRTLERKKRDFSALDIKDIIERSSKKSGDYYNDPDIWDAICRVERARVSNKMRFAIYARDGYRCKKCGRASKNLEIDHIYPISKGGKSTFDNLQALCPVCNGLKGNIVERGAQRPKSRYQENGEVCPKCGAFLARKRGKYGDFYGCPNYPNCNFTKKL